MGEFKYVDWPTGYSFVNATLDDRHVAYIPDGHRAAIFFTTDHGQKVCFMVSLDALDGAMRALHADPASRLRIVNGGKAAVKD